MWYSVTNAQQIDSPALLIYPDRIAGNIQVMLDMVKGEADKLFPHVKTHKMDEVVAMQVDAGIDKFKCATIAEAEMLADTGARHVLLAYQLAGPKLTRFRELVTAYNWVEWASLVDNEASAEALASTFADSLHKPIVYIDVNVGMNRTGHPVNEELESLARWLHDDPRFDFRGFHAYDGHLRDPNLFVRKDAADAAMAPLEAIIDRMKTETGTRPTLIVGGTPTFSVHSDRPNAFCSPGTCLLWDWGYDDLLTEQPFDWAAVLMTRVISKPAPGIVTTDLGHKAVASENPLQKRIKFLNLDEYEVVGQSEEHLVLRVLYADRLQVGDVLYGIPYHICPTVALHDEVQVVRDNEAIERWTVDARRRRLTY